MMRMSVTEKPPINVIDKPLTENLKTPQLGVLPEVDVVADLLPGDYDHNSWTTFGHFEAGGHTLAHMWHLLGITVPGAGKQYASLISVTDETTGDFYTHEAIFPAAQVEVADTTFGISMPNSYLGGDWDRMRIRYEAPSFLIDTEVAAVGYPLYCKGTGRFSMAGRTMQLFNVPYMRTTGSMTVAGKRYDVTGRGYTLFERGWQYAAPGVAGKVSWIPVKLCNGEAISFYHIDAPGYADSWAMVQHPDGSQDFIPIEPLAGSAFWHSDRSGQCYPTRLRASIPAYDAILDIAPVPREQEVVSSIPMLHRYHGSSVVTGTWGGQEVSGHALVFLVGPWA